MKLKGIVSDHNPMGGGGGVFVLVLTSKINNLSPESLTRPLKLNIHFMNNFTETS